jgi:hypothetical protein
MQVTIFGASAIILRAVHSHHGEIVDANTQNQEKPQMKPILRESGVLLRIFEFAGGRAKIDFCRAAPPPPEPVYLLPHKIVSTRFSSIPPAGSQ